MAYKNNIPQPNTLQSISQADLLNNFVEIDNIVSEDHETFTAGVNKGKHKKVILRKQAASPAVVAEEIGVFAKNNAAGDISLFVKNNATEIDITTCKKNIKGYTRLPSGILIQWGSGTIVAGTRTTPAIAYEIPFTAIYSINVTPWGLQPVDIRDAILAVVNATINNFMVTRDEHLNGTARSFRYIAIGS